MGTVRVVIESDPQDGVRNMALDEALLEGAQTRGECTVRWYRWREATVSLGYFQAAEAAGAIPELAGLPMVRRLTGGGAILHHHEWTYSCTVPAGHPLAEVPTRIYDRVHEQVVAGLAERGIQAALRGEALREREGTFLCFGRGDPRDVVLGGQKILGSAQRRRCGAILQHGSLLIRHSEHAPQFPGLLDLVSGTVDEAWVASLICRLGPSLARLFGEVSPLEAHSPNVEERASELLPKYKVLDWKPGKL
jgi:lipoyl(octanoyl) transferase